MLTKSFLELMSVDISSYVKSRDGADYLPWAACLYLLHKEGAENVEFYPVPGPDGHTLRKTDKEFINKSGNKNSVYEVMVHIVVDDKAWDVVYPVVNGTNAVSDNSMSQIRVHSACKRGFVKGVAERLGLGFSLWMKGDDIPEEEPVDDLSKHSWMKCRQRLMELVTYKINSGIPLNVIADRLGRTEDELRSMMDWPRTLSKLEKDITVMQL